jgi:Sec23/Sec24 trunk domain
MPVADCSFTLEKVLEELQRDPWPVPPDQRVARCTGAALEVMCCLVYAQQTICTAYNMYSTQSAQHIAQFAAAQECCTVFKDMYILQHK